MKEEKRGLKYHWKRIVRKKGFFPAVYLVVAALLLTGVLWYQNSNRLTQPDFDLDFNYQDDDEVRGGNDGDNDPRDREEPTEPVATPVENVSLPVLGESNAKIVTKFYQHGSSEEEQEQALVLYNNKFYQSQGIDIAATNDDPLQVVAALSGEVVDVRENALLGYIVEIEHDHDITTFYSSLTDVEVEPSQKVSQGDVIAHAGTNVFNQEKGTHVHFQIRKDGKPVDPESYQDQPVTDVTTEVPDGETEDDDSDQDEKNPQLESGKTTIKS